MEKLLEVLNLLVLRNDFKSQDIALVVLSVGAVIVGIILAKRAKS